LCQVIETLLNNDYQLKFVFEIVYKRLKYHSTKNKNVRIDNEKNKDSISHWNKRIISEMLYKQTNKKS